MSVLTENFSSVSQVSAQFAALRANWAAAAQKRRVYRNTLAELRNLTSRDLADLGIAPSNIHSIAWEAAYGQ